MSSTVMISYLPIFAPNTWASSNKIPLKTAPTTTAPIIYKTYWKPCNELSELWVCKTVKPNMIAKAIIMR